ALVWEGLKPLLNISRCSASFLRSPRLTRPIASVSWPSHLSRRTGVLSVERDPISAASLRRRCPAPAAAHWRRSTLQRRRLMKRRIKQTLVALSAMGGFGCAAPAGQQPSKHVLQDAATGPVHPAKTTLQPPPGAGDIPKPMHVFSGGTLEGE